jgi:3-hydroxy-9,10-secoandrosta-1,3,5(10)-triene-9,17-dione monooxygenase
MVAEFRMRPELESKEMRPKLDGKEIDTTPEEMIARAVALRPMLREKRKEAAARGTYPPDVHRAFEEAGFYRILQPRAFGGYEFGLETFFKVMIEVSAGDPGMGWCLSLGSGHTLPLIAHYRESVVREIFASNSHFIAPHSALARGTATPVEGGYMVSGEWGYSSGVPYSTHFMGTALVPLPDGKQGQIVVIIPRHEYTIVDDWGGGVTMALQASGSNTVRVENVFVSKDWTAPWDWMIHANPEGTYGTALTNNPLYFGNVSPLYPGEIACAQIGAARAALDEFEKIITTKKRISPPQILRYLHPDMQKVFGECVHTVDAAEQITLSVGRDYAALGERWKKTGEAPTLKDYTRLGARHFTAIRLCWEAGEMMFRSAGTTVAKKGEPLQDYFLALAMQRTQADVWGPAAATMLARSHWDLNDSSPFEGSTEVVRATVVMNPLGGHASKSEPTKKQ